MRQREEHRDMVQAENNSGIITNLYTMKPLTHGSLFSGIGAAEIAAEMLGWKNVFQC